MPGTLRTSPVVEDVRVHDQRQLQGLAARNMPDAKWGASPAAFNSRLDSDLICITGMSARIPMPRYQGYLSSTCNMKEATSYASISKTCHGQLHGQAVGTKFRRTDTGRRPIHMNSTGARMSKTFNCSAGCAIRTSVESLREVKRVTGNVLLHWCRHITARWIFTHGSHLFKRIF